MKKDYYKMASGGKSDTDEEAGIDMRENRNVNSTPKVNKQKSSGDNGGNILDGEFFNFDHDSDSLDDDYVESNDEITDAELSNVEKKLKLMKLEEKRLQKVAKYRRLSQEAEEVEKSIKSLQKKNKGGKGAGRKKVTNAELRGMKDVMNEVDKLMDSKVRRKNIVGSSSSSDNGDDDGNSSSDENSEVEIKKGKVVKKKKGSEKKSGKCKSGKDKQITSLVKKQENWPHTYLGLHFINQRKNYEELTLPEFCAGYAAILEECSGLLLMHRISHF